MGADMRKLVGHAGVSYDEEAPCRGSGTGPDRVETQSRRAAPLAAGRPADLHQGSTQGLQE